MYEIGNPGIKCLEDENIPTYGKFIIEPLWEGHGRVLGNSMRRILLSSLPGTAVTFIKIDGVQHEFATIPGVKEDVTEIVLNVKSILAKLYSEDARTICIEAAGECKVVAGDIKTDSDVEILNPDLHIATLGPDAVLSMELTLSHGSGYVPAEQNQVPKVGSIPVDSLYSPIPKVRYDVDTIHIEDLADYDRLTLEVWTDGTITARDAVALSGRILSDHFSLFTDEPMGEFGSAVEKTSDIMDTSIEKLEFSVRSYNCLKRAGIETLRDLVSKSEEDLMTVRSMGRKSLEEIVEKLSKMGFSLASATECW